MQRLTRLRKERHIAPLRRPHTQNQHAATSRFYCEVSDTQVYGQFINNSLRAVNDTDWWYVRKYKAWTEKAGQRPLQRVTSHDTLAKCSQVWLASVDTTPYWQSAQVTPTNKNSIKAGLALQHVNQPAWHFHHASSITPVPTSRFITISFL